jgi:O-antigen/teichoic acid export membrane protein
MRSKLIQLLRSDKCLSLVDTALLSFGRLLGTVFIARLASPEVFAGYIQMIFLGVIVLSLSAAATTTPMQHQLARTGADAQPGTISWFVKRNRMWVLGWCVLGAIALPLITSVKAHPLSALGYLAAHAGLLMLQLERALRQARFQMSSAVTVDLACQLLIALGVLLGALGLVDLMAAFWWSMALGSWAGAWWLGRGRNASQLVQAHRLETAVQPYARPMLVGSAANSACSRLQPFVLEAVCGATQIAWFGVAWTLIAPFRILAGGLNHLLRPRLLFHLSKNNSQACRAALRRCFSVVITAFILAILLVIPLGQTLVTGVFGDAFSRAAILLPYAFLYAALDTLTTVQMVGLHCLRSDGPALATRLRLQAAAISLVLLYPAAFLDGARGALVALVMAEAFYALQAWQKLSFTKTANN